MVEENGDGIALVDAECDEAFCGGEHGIVEFAGSDLRPLAGGGFAFRDHGIFASARYASSKQGIDGFVVAHLNGSPGVVYSVSMKRSLSRGFCVVSAYFCL